MPWLPPPLRRRLAEHDERVRTEARAEGRAAGAATVRAETARDRFRYVFVVTYGRSGSTLVQGLLNALPRTLVRGENNLYLLHFFRSLSAVRDFRRVHVKHGSKESSSAFFGLNDIRRYSFVDAMNQVVVRSTLGQLTPRDFDVLGFKEVLWHRIEPEETEEFFAMMDQAFPGVRYVLNTRDPEAVLGSGFWKRVESDEARTSVERVVEIQEFLRETRPEQVMDVKYEELTGGGEDAVRTLRDLAAFVTGAPPDEALLGSMQELLSVGHGPRPFGSSREDEQ